MACSLHFHRAQFFGTSFAVFVGAAIPLVLLGRVVFAISVVLALLALLASDLRLSAWRHLKQQVHSPVGALIALTLGLWIVSALESSFPLRSLEATLRTGLFCAIGTMVYAGLRDEPKLHELCLRVFVGVSAVCIVIGVLESTILPQLYWTLRLRGWVSHPVNTTLKGFSSLAVMMIPLFAYAAWRFISCWRYVALLTIIATAFLIWITYNRAAIAGFLAMALGLTGAMFIGHRRRKHVLVSALCTMILVIGVLAWLNISRGNVAVHAPPGDWLFPIWLIDFQRQIIWAHALWIADQAPWFGIGANTINFTPGADAPLPGTNGLHVIPAHPHNWAIEILVETGAFGLIALLITIASVMLSFLREFQRSRSPQAVCAIAVMAGYWASGLFNFSYWSAWWQVSFVLALAITGVNSARSSSRASPKTGSLNSTGNDAAR
jgi:O-antigen ligase